MEHEESLKPIELKPHKLGMDFSILSGQLKMYHLWAVESVPPKY